MTKDIEREAFVKSNNVNFHWSFKFDQELEQYVALDHEMQLQVDELNEHWDTFRSGWQAAKAHEAKKLEGCIVVPVEPTPKMIDSTWDDQDEIETMSHNSRNEFIYKKMIEVAMLEAARSQS